MSEEFEDPHGHYTLEKGLLHVKYVLKCFFFKVKTTHESICWVKACSVCELRSRQLKALTRECMMPPQKYTSSQQ